MNSFTRETYLELCKSLERCNKCSRLSFNSELSILIINLVETANTLYLYENSGYSISSIMDLMNWTRENSELTINWIPNKFSADKSLKDVLKLYRSLYALRNIIAHNPSIRKDLSERFLSVSVDLESELIDYFKWIEDWTLNGSSVKCKFNYSSCIEELLKRISADTIIKFK